MRKIILTALCAAGAASSAQAANWTTFVGSNPYFPNQLADRGLAIDTAGYVAVQAYNRLAWSGQIEFVHDYTIDAAGNIPWIWGLTGRGWSNAVTPRGVDQRDGFRLDWIERADDPFSSRDEIAGVPPNSSQPSVWFAQPRADGKVVKIASGGNDGAYALRALDGGAGFEAIALDGAIARWRATVQPCGSGIDPANLDLDYSPLGTWPMAHTVSIAGSCDDGINPPQVFLQRFDTFDGTQAPLQWLAVDPGSTLLRLAFSPGHELVAVYDTPWQIKEVGRIPADGFAPPPAALWNIDQVDALVRSGGDALAIVGTNLAGDIVVTQAAPNLWFPSATALSGLSAYPGGGWSIAASRDGDYLAARTVTSGAAAFIQLVALDAGGALAWTSTIADVLPGAVAQVAPAQDSAGGYVVAVDTQQPDGTIGVHVERVGSP